jgi:hypothetical protein
MAKPRYPSNLGFSLPNWHLEHSEIPKVNVRMCCSEVIGSFPVAGKIENNKK